MSKKLTPAKEVIICDVCRREVPYVEDCEFCGIDYCLSCRAIIPGCAHQVDVCKKCENNDVVLKIVNKHTPLIVGALQSRRIEIIKAGKKFQAAQGSSQ